MNKNKKEQEKAQKEFNELRHKRRTRFYDNLAQEMNQFRYQNRKTITKGNQ